MVNQPVAGEISFACILCLYRTVCQVSRWVGTDDFDFEVLWIGLLVGELIVILAR